jgi:hypothetical protein
MASEVVAESDVPVIPHESDSVRVTAWQGSSSSGATSVPANGNGSMSLTAGVLSGTAEVPLLSASDSLTRQNEPLGPVPPPDELLDPPKKRV